ncbi:MAG: PAS domain-containing sensor histidine kinase [Deltaproteobacteria bacterium]|jgi:signal transduction histidine kinase|nr:PAS domain-containing sensor histidine kinase [Deltaproteobacteria bacterium]
MQLTDAGKGTAGCQGQEAWNALEWGSGFWKSLFDELDLPIIVYRPDGQIVWANREAAGLLGPEGCGRASLPASLQPLVHGCLRLEAFSRGRDVTLATAGNGRPLRFVIKRLPSEGLGDLILAAGVSSKDPEGIQAPEGDRPAADADPMALAGEFSRTVKGPLAGIELYASILGEELSGAGEGGLSDMLDEIRLSVREVNEYLTSLESMTRPLSLDLKGWNVSALVDEALEALGGLFKSKGIGVLVEHCDVTVECDRTLMVQTFLNLILNAAEAMPCGGRLIVRESLNRSGECEVIFTDSGPGVGINDVKRIFNPFYTTKSQNLGLGLPVSRRIVEAHQGRVAFGNDDDLGARVKVVLPCFPRQAVSGKLN